MAVDMTSHCSIALLSSADASNGPIEMNPSEWDSKEVLQWLITIVLSPSAANYGIPDTFPFERFSQTCGNDLLQVKEADLDFLPPKWAQFLVKKVKDLTPPSKGPLLWQFLRDELLHSDTPLNPTMKWVNRNEGVFKICDSRSAKILAEKWGARKDNKSMNYAKLSKAIRTYYRKGIILPVRNKRYTYKFGPESTGWRIRSDIPEWNFD